MGVPPIVCKYGIILIRTLVPTTVSTSYTLARMASRRVAVLARSPFELNRARYDTVSSLDLHLDTLPSIRILIARTLPRARNITH